MSFLIKNESHRPEILDRIFNFYIASGLTLDASDVAVSTVVKSLLNDFDSKDKEEVRHTSFELYPHMFEKTGDEQAGADEFLMAFNNFLKVLYSKVTRHRSEFANMEGIRRNPLPNLEALEYSGHNDLSITDRPARYTLAYHF